MLLWDKEKFIKAVGLASIKQISNFLPDSLYFTEILFIVFNW